jgi:hypothetical protein
MMEMRHSFNFSTMIKHGKYIHESVVNFDLYVIEQYLKRNSINNTSLYNNTQQYNHNNLQFKH